jgi:hypothetical protein
MLACTLAAVLTSTGVAHAQEQGQIGITMGYPESIGVIYHVTDAVALRPEFLFRRTTLDGALDENATTSVGIGVSGLIYLSKRDALHTYVAPRFNYTRVSSEIETTFPSVPLDLINLLPSIGLTIPPISIETTTTAKTVSGAFGAQYRLHDRFAIFGEVGLAYGWTDRSPLFERLDLDRSGPRTIGTSTAVGVIIYFKD